MAALVYRGTAVRDDVLKKATLYKYTAPVSRPYDRRAT